MAARRACAAGGERHRAGDAVHLVEGVREDERPQLAGGSPPPKSSRWRYASALAGVSAWWRTAPMTAPRARRASSACRGVAERRHASRSSAPRACSAERPRATSECRGLDPVVALRPVVAPVEQRRDLRHRARAACGPPTVGAERQGRGGVRQLDARPVLADHLPPPRRRRRGTPDARRRRLVQVVAMSRRRGRPSLR